MKFRQGIVSAAIFCVMLAGLVSVDDRVRDRFSDLVRGGNGLTPWGDRLSDVAGALVSALRHQSIENAPLLVFTVVGMVLVIFMVKT